MASIFPLTKRKLELLFEIYSKKESYLREITRSSGMSLSLAARIIGSLLKAGMIEKERRGKEIYYRLTKRAEEFIPLLETFYLEKRTEQYGTLKAVVGMLKESELFKECDKIYIFGSYAKGSAKKDSDIDILFIINKKELKTKIAAFCREISAISHVQINGIALTKKEFNEAKKKKEAFVTAIMQPSERLIVK